MGAEAEAGGAVAAGSDARRGPPRALALAAAGTAIWTVLALLSATQTAVYLHQIGRPIVWPALLGATALDWYTCAAFTPAFFWLARRCPLDRGHLARSLPVLVAAISVFVVAKYALLARVPLWRGPDPAPFASVLGRHFISESVIMWAVLGVVYGVEYYGRLRERELQLAKLAGELTAARLDALSAQLQPHFLFNALNGVSTLMHRDVEAADAMLANLADLLRRTLEGGAAHEVPLHAELELLRSYLEVVRARFADRLSVSIDVDPEAARALVPRLILQPLVENAIEHGIARRRGAGTINVRARRRAVRLELSVQDDGVALRRRTTFPREGIGLSNTRRRLRELYGDDHALTLEPVEAAGLRVVLSLPYRPESARAVDSPIAAAPPVAAGSGAPAASPEP